MRNLVIVIIVAVVTAACTGMGEIETVSPAAIPSATATAFRTSTSLPTRTPTPTATPLPYPRLDIQNELSDLSSGAELHNIIIFSAREAQPFAADENAPTVLTRLGNFEMESLWALALDGRSAGRISADGHDFFMNLPPSGKPQMITYGFSFDHPSIETITLPDICTQIPDDQPWALCDQLLLSRDGRYLAFRYAEDMCGRSMQVIDRTTGEVILERDGRVHGVGFLPNGYVSISEGHCEGSNTWFYDPVRGETIAGGGVGLAVWNPLHSINVQIASDYMGTSSSFWGYMADTGTVFRVRDVQGRTEYDTHVMFLPNGREFLYQHWSYAFIDPTGVQVRLDEPMQIVRYDPYTGESTILTPDPGNHYRFCQFDYESPCPLEWHGDWIQVQRLPFAEETITIDYDWFPELDLPCLFGNPPCDVAKESMALNTQTGELRLWDPSSLPAVSVQPTSTAGPEPNGRIVYADPNGLYHFAVGNDGKSLWMVPAEGEPVRWVWSGSNYLYLP